MLPSDCDTGGTHTVPHTGNSRSGHTAVIALACHLAVKWAVTPCPENTRISWSLIRATVSGMSFVAITKQSRSVLVAQLPVASVTNNPLELCSMQLNCPVFFFMNNLGPYIWVSFPVSRFFKWCWSHFLQSYFTALHHLCSLPYPVMLVSGNISCHTQYSAGTLFCSTDLVLVLFHAHRHPLGPPMSRALKRNLLGVS